MDYDLDLIAGQTVIRFWLCRVDANGLPVQADTAPTTAVVDKNGTTLTLTTHYTITVGTWNATKGYLVTITLVTALATNDTIGVFMNAAYTAVTKYFAAGGTAVSAAADATLAKQNEILSRLTAVTRIYTNPRNPNRLELIRGDAYDGTSWPSLAWTLDKDCTSATVTLTIRDGEADTVLLTKTGTGNGTGVTVSISSADYDTLTVGQHKFDVQVVFSATSKQTPGLGICEVIEDQTR